MNKISATFEIHTLTEIITVKQSRRIVEVLTTIHETEKDAVFYMIDRDTETEDERRPHNKYITYIHSFYLDNEFIGEF